MRATLDPGDIEAIAALPTVRRANESIDASDGETLDDMRTAVRIPAPSFGEAERAAWLARRFAEVGLDDVATDAAGNVLGRHAANGTAAAPVVVAAHLDTVFPADTELRVVEEHGRILAPGIADNARGLAALLAVARAFRAGDIVTHRPVVFCGTVGEEGVGDLRGVKHLFRAGAPWRECAAFIALDGTGRRRIAHRAVGSRRLRAQLLGPGGHSWADRDAPNPIHTLAAAVTRLVAMRLPGPGASSLSVGRIGGGTSVNAVPAAAWLEIDLRSEEGAALAELESRARAILDTAVQDANGARARETAPLRIDVSVIGDRPNGETPATSRLVRAARAATRAIGERPELVASSTDANVPIALGIPAIALGAGGDSGSTHTLAEWYSNDGGPDGIRRALLTLVAVAGAHQ
jgi:acetylornithine deacetylase/succinyl-diaminopimelate desuccinylase-like protein